MNEKDLEQIIKNLNDPNLGNIMLDRIKADFFLEQPEYRDLKKLFKNSKYHDYGWKWHQLVRIVLEDPEIKRNMYDRLLSLILKHRKSFEDYFELKTEEGTYWIPNTIADMNRLEILYNDYLKTYRDIMNYLYINYLKICHSGNYVKGKIDWPRTIRGSYSEYPLSFSTISKKINFITSENILLILCTEWMFRESLRLLQIEFKEPLTDHNRKILHKINAKMKFILKCFPFNDVLDFSIKYFKLPYNYPKIKLLEQESWNKVKQNMIHNPAYDDLLMRIERFRELNVSNISSDIPTKHILDSIKNIDTVYEACVDILGVCRVFI